MRRIVLVLPSLDTGGTERQAVATALALAAAGHGITVAVLTGGGPMTGDLQAAGIPIQVLGPGRLAAIAALWRLAQQWGADAVYGYLPTANLVCATLKAMPWRPRIVFGIRTAGLPLHEYPAVVRLAYGLQGWAARWLADLVICNSEAARAEFLACGLPTGKVRAVPNGIDTSRFRPDAEARAAQRAEWGLAPDAVAIGLPARIDPLKDHATFLAAAGILARCHAQARFFCIGGGDPAARQRLERQAAGLGLDGRLTWTGGLADMTRALNGLDVVTLTSRVEGFPNALAEAMACGLPCVGTQVGDVAALLGDAGLVVPPGDPVALAEAWDGLMEGETRQRMGAAGRHRVEAEYGLAALASRTLRAMEL